MGPRSPLCEPGSCHTEDWLGLRDLDRRGGLKFKTTPGRHMQLVDEVLNATFKEFFGPLKKSTSLNR